jgi:protein O-GlcNAc transferase
MTINDALRLHHAGRLDEAEGAYRQVLALQPNQYHALHFLGVLKAQQGDMASSIDLIARSLALFADNPLAEFHLAEAYRKRNETGEAAAHYRRAVALDPAFAPAAAGLAGCLTEAGQPDEALACCDRALASAPGMALLHTVRGEALVALARHDAALEAFAKALMLDPVDRGALIGRARLKHEHGDDEAAFADLARAAEAHPGEASVLVAAAVLHGDLGRRDEALAIYQQALALDPAAADTYFSMGCLLSDAGALGPAIAAFDSAIAIAPHHVAARTNRAHDLIKLDRLDEALADSDAALACDPESGLAAGLSFVTRMRRCDWRGREARVENLARLVRAGRPVDPFALALAFDDPALQLQAAKTWALPAAAPLPVRPLSEGRLKIAYLSPNFHPHPVAHLTVQMFEAHDRTRFETFGVCTAPGPDTAIRSRLKLAFEHFLEVGGAPDRELAGLLFDQGIDIVVDLAGYTAEGRTAALRWRPCPLQIGWLGFPGTSGASFIDYLVADPVIIPPGLEAHYSEQIVRLPDSYMPRDGAVERRPCPGRADLALPADGLVFCGFNNAVKITPSVFGVWMRLLEQVPGSVLWLNSQDAKVRANLVAEAASRGVAGERIVFAPRVEERADHLARLAAADLFLDTTPYGAHSTASDFLWAGVPVLTVEGRSFASRVAPGLLASLGLGDLAVRDLAAYEACALSLARDPGRLGMRKAKLAETVASAPLFDPLRFCRGLESAYESMAERFRAGAPPASFSVTLPVG